MPSTGFTRKRQTNESGYNTGELKNGNRMDKEIAEEIIRETVIRPDMTYKTICLTMRILCFLWRTERSCLMTSTSGKNVPTSNLKNHGPELLVLDWWILD